MRHREAVRRAFLQGDVCPARRGNPGCRNGLHASRVKGPRARDPLVPFLPGTTEFDWLMLERFGRTLLGRGEEAGLAIPPEGRDVLGDRIDGRDVDDRGFVAGHALAWQRSTVRVLHRPRSWCPEALRRVRFNFRPNKTIARDRSMLIRKRKRKSYASDRSLNHQCEGDLYRDVSSTERPRT